MAILYPPIVDTYMPAFTATEGCYINFTMPSLNNPNDIGKIIISIADQKTNRNILSIPDDKDSTKFLEFLVVEFDASSNKIHLNKTDIFKNMQIDNFYKVQLKFVSKNVDLDSNGVDVNWLIKNSRSCSEWSTVCLIKKIEQPRIILRDYPEDNSANLSYPKIWSKMNGTFNGYLSFPANETETLKSFRITVYHKNELVVDSKDKYTGGNVNVNEFQYIPNYNFQNGETYRMFITCVTQYDYIITKEFYFMYFQVSLSSLPSLSFSAVNEEDFSRIKIQIDSKELFIGNFVIRRTSNKSDFNFWEDIHFGSYTKEDNFNYTWYDYTIENGIIYKYCIQKLTQKKGTDGTTTVFRSNGIVSNVVLATFESTFLTSGGQQLNIKYNATVDSFSTIVQESKVETLGSKYPFIQKNGNVKYKEFSLSGLITLHMDENNAFLFNIKDSTSNFKIKSDNLNAHTFSSYDNTFDFSSNNNIMLQEKTCYEEYNKNKGISKYNDTIYEQKFRNKVLEFLQNSQVKLFKSPTEGNILVKLTNISLSPEGGLNRHLYNFSCTATEIDEFTLSNCDKYNIQIIGAFEEAIFKEQEHCIFSQEWIKTDKVSVNVCNNIANKILYKTKTSLTQHIFQHLNYVRIEFQSKPYLIYKYVGSNPVPVYGHMFMINGQPMVVTNDIFELSGDDVQITQLDLYPGVEALINYSAVYTIEERQQKEKTNQYLTSNIGQICDNFTTSEDDTLLIRLNKKYYFDDDNSYQQINAINELNIEAEPGTICCIKDFNESDYERHVIGPTGVLRVFEDGIDPLSDDSKLIENLYFDGLEFHKLNPSQIKVAALHNGYVDYNEYMNNSDIRFDSTDNITNPIANCVYKIGEKDLYKRYIYYNDKWYEFQEGDYIKPDTVYAMVTYTYIKERGEYLAQ